MSCHITMYSYVCRMTAACSDQSSQRLDSLGMTNSHPSSQLFGRARCYCIGPRPTQQCHIHSGTRQFSNPAPGDKHHLAVLQANAF